MDVSGLHFSVFSVVVEEVAVAAVETSAALQLVVKVDSQAEGSTTALPAYLRIPSEI